MNSEGKKIDKQLYPLLKRIKEKHTIILETYNSTGLTAYPSIDFQSLYPLIKLLRCSTLFEKETREIQVLVNDYFQVDLDISFFNDRVKAFLLEKKLWKLLLIISRPERIIVVQNGIQKALFSTAKSLDVKVHEVQHGNINESHPAYHFPFPELDFKYCSFPYEFVALGTYWLNNCFYPVESKKVIGAFKFDTQKKLELDYVFYSSAFHQDEIVRFSNYLSKRYSQKKIAVKFHPNEYFNKSALSSRFNKDIRLIFDEFSSEEIIAGAEVSMLVQSTLLYEILQESKQVVILKALNYLESKEIFHHPNVELAETPEELLSKLEKLSQKPPVVNAELFFEAFSEKVCNELIDIS